MYASMADIRLRLGAEKKIEEEEEGRRRNHRAKI